MTNKTAAQDSIFILLAAVACHYLFSAYGFNPTDEGFVLSASNRVLHGQVPHVDFSSMRPLGYAYLHIPELLFSKNHIFLISRFVFWLEQVLIAYLWIRWLVKQTDIRLTAFNTYLLAVITLIFNVHYFPASVLHTIDGLLMCLIGLNLIASEKKYFVAGFFFIGFAALCKQNYLAVLPFSVLLFGRKKFVRSFLIGLSPIILYVAFVVLHHGWNDLVTQLSGHHELAEVGLKRYLFSYLLYAGIAGALMAKKIKIPATIYLAGLLIFMTALLITDHYHGSWGLLIFGALLAETFGLSEDKKTFHAALACLVLAWSVSISVGYNTPALFLGGCISFIIMVTLHRASLHPANYINMAAVLLLSATFYIARTHNLYRDVRAADCNYPIGSLVEGTDGIRTNARTYVVLAELDSLKKADKHIIIIPDFTACNILHSHASGIRTEWPNKTEVPNEAILQKVMSGIRPGADVLFAIPLYQTALLKDGFIHYPDGGSAYSVVRFVKSRYKKIRQSAYFEIYGNR